MNKWILFAHQINPGSQNMRVKVWRNLKRYGAVLFKNTVYILPYSKEHEEMMQWLCKQIKDSGNDASLFITESYDEGQEAEIIKAFHEVSGKEYCSLSESCEALSKKIEQTERTEGLTEGTMRELQKKLREITKWYEEISKVDFFQAPQRSKAKNVIGSLQKKLEYTPNKFKEEVHMFGKTYHVKDFENKKWVTRKDVYIDRIASAWLIKSFIDKKAQFVFLQKNAKKPPQNTIPFDMYGSEFTHHGDDCTFETLVKAFQFKDAALQDIAEIVHDIDLKDGKYSREDAEGIERVIHGLCLTIKDDNARLKKGAELFDALYAFYSMEK